MSTPAEHLVASEMSVERRFYPRIEPSALISVPFGEDNAGMLLNVSENGLLVSTPVGLERNFVTRVSLSLNGLATRLEVCVRVVWISDSNRAGIQMLDLSDHGREQIRRWAAVQGVQERAAEQTGTLQEENPPAEQIGRQVNKKLRLRVSMTVGALAAVLLIAMGLALSGSPLREWLARSVKAGTKDATAMRVVGQPSNRPVDAQKQNVAPAGVALSTNGNAGTSDVTGSKGAELENSAAPMKTMAAPSTRKNPGEKKLAVKKSAGSDLRRPANKLRAAQDDSDISGARDSGIEKAQRNGSVLAGSRAEPQASQNAPNTTAEGSGGDKKLSEEAANNLMRSANADPLHSNDAAPNAPAESSALAADARPVDPGTPSKTGSPDRALVATTGSAVIEMGAPKTRTVEVTLPNGGGASFLSVPGEQVVQSQTVTLHIQRSILAPPGHSWLSSERKMRVELGELRSRVDPRLPRAAEQSGGRVSVRALLGKDGRVERLMPVNGPAELVPSVVRAVREWQFEPTLMDGKAIETEALVLVEFHSEN